MMTKEQRLVLCVSILASFIAFLDGSVINVALPAISAELGGGLASQQWIVDSYLITLGSLILIAGSLSDLFGRKKILAVGLWGFALSSILCAVAPTNEFLIVARALQGVAGALLVPSSLALIIAAFSGEKQSRAIGIWTAWTGMAFLIGPLLGGFLVDFSSWRYIFAINLIPIVATIGLLSLLKPEKRPPRIGKVDYIGAILCTAGLGGPVYALIEQPHYGWTHPLIAWPLFIGILSLVLLIWHERRTPKPMLPLDLFKVRNFFIGNMATIAIYGGLSLATFLISVFTQQVGHYTALEAGLSLLPVTIIMFLLSPRFGSLAGKVGPRVLMTIGPLIASLGFIIMLRVDASVHYWTQLFPGVLLFGLGLAVTVAPLTSAVLGAIDKEQAGIGSAINNALARVAGLLAIAALGLFIGSELTLESFKSGLIVTAALLLAGGLLSAAGIRTPRPNN